MHPMREKTIEYVRSAYSVEPDCPFSGSPEAIVFRHQPTRKWFGLIMEVQRSRLGLPGGGMVSVLNVKCPALLSGSLRMQEGILPAYHMNKNSWISILLDGSVPEETVRSLIDMSFDLTRKAVRKRKPEDDGE